MKNNLNKIQPYLREVFYFLTAALFVFYILELIKPNIVIAYLNLAYLLIIWILVAIVIIVNNK